MGLKEKTAQPQELPGSWYWFSWTLLERLTWFFQRHYLIWCFDYCSAESCLTYTKLLLYELYVFNCVLLQIYNQPIKWQHLCITWSRKPAEVQTKRQNGKLGWYKAHWTEHCCLCHSQPKTRKVRQQFTLAHQNWTAEDWKYVSCSDEPLFLLQHWDSRVQIWCKQHGYILPCISGPVC